MRITTRRRLTATAAATTLALVLAACSGQPEPATAPSPDGAVTEEQPAESVAEHNDEDVQFTQMMIVHHEGALEMAELAAQRASTTEVKALAERIAAAQGPEIELMSRWLEEWGEDQPGATDHGGMDHGGMDMDGMSQEDAMASLEQLEGADLDRAFLELMVAHHRGAVDMAVAEIAEGAHPDVLALARTIRDTQNVEITEMENVLRGL